MAIKKLKSFLYFSFFFLSSLSCTPLNKTSYWEVQHKGANFFNKNPTEEWFIHAKKTNIQFARMAVEKWVPEERDFLLGDADDFQKISFQDLQKLYTVLDDAHRHDIGIVLTLISLPGCRWRQSNDGNDDAKIWQDAEFQKKALVFWKELAFHLKDHPALIGYNILNEPHPELLSGISYSMKAVDFKNWYDSVKGTPSDLNLFYKNAIEAIRSVDAKTPIILDTGLYASPLTFEYLTPIDSPGIVYSFHMYEPYLYTTKKMNQDAYKYPGSIPLHVQDSEKTITTIHQHWDKNALKEFLKPVVLWQEKFKIPSSQILVGEFGCARTLEGADKYLKHLIELFEEQKWHWAFYSFREDDGFASMDYELGPKKLWKYWEAFEKGENLDQFRKDNHLFNVIKESLQVR